MIRPNQGTGDIITRTGGILLAMVLALSSAVVAGQEVPLTPASNCHYSDPAQSGQGIDLRVRAATETAPARVFATLYVGAIPHVFYYQPTWFSVQGDFAEGDGDSQTIPVYQVQGVVLGQGNTQSLVPVGHIRLTAVSDTIVFAELHLELLSGFSPAELPIDVEFTFRCLAR